ncbi:hypothetical protein NDQ57_01065 [Rossellomorea marisflavi]|uniref:hypothetical protein n=1 Tax=Rossellomorea marisflavi TaxID=189381 RepID=UPI00203D2D19|nr:hypothetical protein [Rossellomorea marisflavi]MCM2603296.1 hypothetical protein [Rossellomorea marisflavi]
MIHYLGTPVLETERMILRKLELSDAQCVFDHWLSDDRVIAPHGVSRRVENAPR